MEIESPYKTYKNTGLPVGPICNPGQASIEAVLYPDENDYPPITRSAVHIR